MVDDTEHLNILFPHEKIREEQNKFISDVKETINNKKINRANNEMNTDVNIVISFLIGTVVFINFYI